MNYRVNVFLSILSLCCLLAFGQQKTAVLPNNFYKHYVGQIGDNVCVHFNLIRVGNKLSGNFFYYAKSGDSATITVMQKRSRTFDLQGYIVDDQVTISEPKTSGAIFYGTLIDAKNITGEWKPKNSRAVLPFTMEENYENGSLPFTLHLLHKESRLMEKDKVPYAAIDLALLTPASFSGYIGVKDTIISFIQTHFNSQLTSSIPPQQLLYKMQNDFFNQYRTACSVPYHNGGRYEDFMWEKSKSCYVIFNDYNILSMSVSNEVVTGKARKTTMRNALVLDMKSGTKLKMNKLFSAEDEVLLSELIETEIRKQFGIDANALLKDVGFFVDKIVANDNFYVNSNGIGFIYNPYEIGGVEMGIIDVYLPKEKISSMLKQTSVVYKMFTTY